MEKNTAKNSRTMPFGLLLVVLGCATFVASLGRDGFTQGAFIGGTIALMALGAYLLSNAAKARTATATSDKF